MPKETFVTKVNKRKSVTIPRRVWDAINEAKVFGTSAENIYVGKMVRVTIDTELR